MKRIITLLLAISFIGSGAVYSQINFTILNKNISYATTLDSLARTGVSAGLPVGFAIYQSNNNIAYTADAGDSANANIYSYGARNAFLGRVRALGSIGSKADTCYYGIEFRNNTGYAINSLTIAYTVEQWHLGASGRGADTTEFDFSNNATSLTGTGSWTHYGSLDMISPVTTGTPGPLNGQLAANQVNLTFKISGINKPNGANFWVRWYDHIIKGPNDGLGIQALTINAYSNIAGATVVTKINSGKFPQTAGVPDTTVYGKFHGLVLSPNFVSNGGLQFSIRDSIQTNGPQAGIGAITCISTTDLSGYKPNIGDSIYVTGKIRSYKYLTYLQLDTLKILKANKNPNPVSITVNNINDNNESNLIKLNNLTLSPTATWDTTGASVLGGFTTTARTGAGGNVTIFINKNSNIFLRHKPNFPFNLNGIALQSGTAPNNGYFIWPRFAADFDTLPMPKIPLKNIGDINAYRTNNIPQIYGLADSTNRTYFVKGVVHSPNLYYGGLYFNLIDNTGAITVYNIAAVDGYKPQIGDSVLVGGVIQQLNGLIVIAADSIKFLNYGKPIPPQLTSAPIVKAQESYLITIKHARIVTPKAWDSTKIASYNTFEVRIVSGLDTFFMNISKTTDLFRKSLILGAFNVTGVVGEYSTNAKMPYNDHYEIIPRGSFDIVQTKIPAYTIGQIKPYNATSGAADSIGVTCFTKGVVQSGNLTDTGFVAFGIGDKTGFITVANINKVSGYNPTIGDSIILLGTVNQAAGLTVFVPDSIHLLNAANKTLTPVVITKLNENEESALITVQAFMMVDPNEWDNSLPANKYGFNVRFYKGTDTVIAHISDNAPSLYNLPYSQKPLGWVDITGIELQKTNLAKAPFANYYIEPRQLTDFNTNSGIETITNTGNNIKIFPNPSRGSVNILSSVNIEKLTLSDMEGKQWIMLQNQRTGNVNLDISTLKPGIYVLQINNANGVSVQKIIRE